MLGGILSNRLPDAPRFVLIDSNGVTRAEFGVSNEDPARLRLIDRSGNERVRLDAGFGSQGPCFFCNDSHDKPLVAFCARDDHTEVLDLLGPDEKITLIVGSRGIDGSTTSNLFSGEIHQGKRVQDRNEGRATSQRERRRSEIRVPP